MGQPAEQSDRQKLHDFRGLSGQIASGIVRKGQEVVVLPAGIKTTVKDIWTYDGPLARRSARNR
jgi:sulfate adenylyltransferase subunit 1 (EFTu-like GTPase family)